MNKNMIIKLALTVIAIVALFFSYRYINQRGGADSDGSITFILIDEKGNKVIEDEIEYKAKKADGSTTTLFNVLDAHYELTCANAKTYQPDPTCGKKSEGVGGKIVLGVGETTTDFYNTYLAVYKNGTYTSQGLTGLQFSDGDTIELRVTRLE